MHPPASAPVFVAIDGRPLSSPQPTLSLVGLRFKADLATTHHGLRYLGPTLRGLFGFILKDLVCITPHRCCERCRLRAACPFTRVFDGVPSRPDAPFAGMRSAPPPFVLGVAAPDSWWGSPDELVWTITLFGSASAWAPYIIEAFVQAGEQGVGRHRVPFSVRTVTDAADGSVAFAAGSETVDLPSPRRAEDSSGPVDGVVRWWLDTPLDLRDRGGVLAEFGAAAFVKAGRRRFHALISQHGTGVSPPPVMPAEAYRVVNHDLRVWTCQRYSNRSRSRMTLGGRLGWIDIEGPWSSEGPWAAVAPKTHIGKHTAFGFGSVRWEQLA